jgi:hypothetical protein
MKDIPFTSYDFWGYLTAGFGMLFVADYVWDTKHLQRDSWMLVEGLVAVALAYMVGHVIAGMAAFLWEGVLLRQWIGAPTDLLMGTERRSGSRFWTVVAPTYFKPLEQSVRDRIIAKATADGVPARGEGLFWAAFAATRSSDQAQARLSHFLNQYALCRNLSFAACVATIVLIYAAATHRHPGDGWWAALSAFLSAAMYLRYMKFYRHYAIEVLTTYAHAK